MSDHPPRPAELTIEVDERPDGDVDPPPGHGFVDEPPTEPTDTSVEPPIAANSED